MKRIFNQIYKKYHFYKSKGSGMLCQKIVLSDKISEEGESIFITIGKPIVTYKSEFANAEQELNRFKKILDQISKIPSRWEMSKKRFGLN